MTMKKKKMKDEGKKESLPKIRIRIGLQSMQRQSIKGKLAMRSRGVTRRCHRCIIQEALTFAFSSEFLTGGGTRSIGHSTRSQHGRRKERPWTLRGSYEICTGVIDHLSNDPVLRK